MNTSLLSSMTAEEFDAFCAHVDAEADEARRGGFVSGDVLVKGEAAVAEATRRRAQANVTGREISSAVAEWILSALIAAGTVAGIIALVIAVTRTPSTPPAHFGNCPAGQHWEQLPASALLPGWECVR